jgi:hypothetical protein
LLFLRELRYQARLGHRQVQEGLLETVTQHGPLAQRAALLLVDLHAEGAPVLQVEAEVALRVGGHRLEHPLARFGALLSERGGLVNELLDGPQGLAQRLRQQGLVVQKLVEAHLHFRGRLLQARERQAAGVEGHVHLVASQVSRCTQQTFLAMMSFRHAAS